jgi:hypothetical protein
MKKQFIVNRQGKDFALYAGLLDQAHTEGLKRIETTLLQVPSEENGHVAIVHAIVETEKGCFSGLGDASPLNVARPMVTVLIRLAETRSKARALRDAINVGMIAFEELTPGGEGAEDDEPGEMPPARPRPAPMRRPAPRSEPAEGDGVGEATAAQIRAIYAIGRNGHNLSEAEIDARCEAEYGRRPDSLTKRQASELISSLQGSSSVRE